jgi:hypothetical protein
VETAAEVMSMMRRKTMIMMKDARGDMQKMMKTMMITAAVAGEDQGEDLVACLEHKYAR